MYAQILNTIASDIFTRKISDDRLELLHPIIDYLISETRKNDRNVNLNFICTHNSRRSQLAQIWAQVAITYYNIQGIDSYSGGTEITAIYPQIINTLSLQGFKCLPLSLEINTNFGLEITNHLNRHLNTVYAIKYDDNAVPIIGFSKLYNSEFNPKSNFIALLTCAEADTSCPIVIGALNRFPLNYQDPKEADGTPLQAQVYLERSLDIAAEMFYIFSRFKI